MKRKRLHCPANQPFLPFVLTAMLSWLVTLHRNSNCRKDKASNWLPDSLNPFDQAKRQRQNQYKLCLCQAQSQTKSAVSIWLLLFFFSRLLFSWGQSSSGLPWRVGCHGNWRPRWGGRNYPSEMGWTTLNLLCLALVGWRRGGGGTLAKKTCVTLCSVCRPS